MSENSIGKSTAHPMLKIVALILLVIWVVIASGYRPWDQFLSPQARFEKVWREDFEKLKSSKSLPPGFDKIKKTEIRTPSEKLKEFLARHNTPHFGASVNGKNTLEVFLDQTEDGGVMVQYDLVDEKGNTIWELGQTFNQNFFKK